MNDRAFTFDEATHTYRLGAAVVPSVTQLIDGALVNYSCVPPDVLERARKMGTAVHLATALYDGNDLDEASLDPQLRPYLDAWIRFRSETGFQPLVIEEKFHHPKLGYAGTPDRTGTLDGDAIVLDLKKMLTIPAWVGVQTAAYQELLRANGVKAKRRFGLSLRADGTYKMHEFKEASDWSCFLSLLTLSEWVKRHG